MLKNFDINFCKDKKAGKCYRCNKMCPTLKRYWCSKVIIHIDNLLAMIKYSFHECTDKESMCPCRAYGRYCTEYKTCKESMK